MLNIRLLRGFFSDRKLVQSLSENISSVTVPSVLRKTELNILRESFYESLSFLLAANTLVLFKFITELISPRNMHSHCFGFFIFLSLPVFLFFYLISLPFLMVFSFLSKKMCTLFQNMQFQSKTSKFDRSVSQLLWCFLFYQIMCTLFHKMQFRVCFLKMFRPLKG